MSLGAGLADPVWEDRSKEESVGDFGLVSGAMSMLPDRSPESSNESDVRFPAAGAEGLGGWRELMSLMLVLHTASQCSTDSSYPVPFEGN